MSACVFLLLHEIQILILKSYSIWLCIRCPHHGIQWRICLVVKLFWHKWVGGIFTSSAYIYGLLNIVFRFDSFVSREVFKYVGTLSWLTWHILRYILDIYPHTVFVNRFEIIDSKGFFKNIDWNPQFVQTSSIVVLNTTYKNSLLK